MEYRCPYCGNVIKAGLYCNQCLNKVSYFQKVWDKSAFYYNVGLKAAKNRQLSGAACYLQKSVELYKYNVEARNLLGLIYYEMGQTGMALKEWIVSRSIKKKANIASDYIEAIHKEPRALEASKEAASLYNKALSYLHQGDMDMAIIRLKKAASIWPNFIEARVLLALCYMEQKQFHKANEQVKRVLAIDTSHPQALVYFKELSKEDTQTIQPYELEYQSKTMKPARSGNLDKVMDRGKYLGKCVVYFVLGAVAAGIVYQALILPNRIKTYQDEAGRLKDSEAVLSKKVQLLTDDDENKVGAVQTSKDQLEKEVAEYETQITTYTQKEKLTSAKQQIDEGDYVEAAKTLYSIAATSLSEEEKADLDSLKERAYPNAAERLYEEGVSAYEQENYVEAKGQFETVLLYEPGDRLTRKTLYYLGNICEANQDVEGAKQYYQKVMAEYPDTREAYRAEDRLDEMGQDVEGT